MQAQNSHKQQGNIEASGDQVIQNTQNIASKNENAQEVAGKNDKKITTNNPESNSEAQKNSSGLIANDNDSDTLPPIAEIK